MKTIQTALLVISVALAATSFAAQPANTEVAKKAARDTCLAQAKETYGSATTNTKPKRKKIGKVKGYSFNLKVGERNRKIKCLADANGETIFYDAGR